MNHMNPVWLFMAALSAISAIACLPSEGWFLCPVFAWCCWKYLQMAAEE